MANPSVIEIFRSAVAKKDLSSVAGLLTPDVELYPSVSHRPFKGKDTAVAVFTMLVELFDSIEYVAEYQSEDGISLLIRGSIRGKDADGAQFLRFNSEGLVVEFRDFLRPLTALQALRDAAGEYMQRASAGGANNLSR